MSDIHLTQEELDAMPAKTKKHQHVMDMYLQHDFKTAYAMHTDDRVKDGYEGAIGAAHLWDELGELHFDWLKRWGLKPHHNLLDFGCGTGRLARKVVPYLEEGHYFGADLSEGALEAATELAFREGWYEGVPTFSPWIDPRVQYDYVWAFSVFIHNPYEIMVESMKNIAAVMPLEGRFYFSWTNEPYYVRSGLKQFRHTREMYERACDAAGLTFTHVEEYKQPQLVALAQLK